MTTLLLLAFALATDAFCVAVAQGASTRPGPGGAIRMALAFGVAQALMPLVGWGLGRAFAGAIEQVDHWIAFALLAAIGAKMIREATAGGGTPAVALSGMGLLTAALATSVDAAAAGIALPTLGLPVGLAAGAIGAITAALCLVGALAGGAIGARGGRKAEAAGGLVLIGLGLRILLQHTGWL